MDLPVGRTLVLIAVLALLGAVAIPVTRRSAAGADQVVWVFDGSHRDTYTKPTGAAPPLTQLHQEATGKSVEIQLMPSRALDGRLLSLIFSDAHGSTVPDLVEVEIGSVGKYFRAPAERCGLLPLDSYIASDKDAHDLLLARLETWTHDGKVLGIPRDVHPVTITYREDLFAMAGVDLARCGTWNEFRDACLRYQRYFAARGEERSAMQLARWNASDLMILVYQQRIAVVDARGWPDLSDPRLAQAIAFYAGLVAGKDAIGSQVPSGASTEDLADGHTGALFTPDWRIDYLRENSKLVGKLRMMPLPRFRESDAPTASWGGTMVAIPANARDPGASWQLLHDLHLSPQAMEARAAHSSILPANREAWQRQEYLRPDSLFGRQRIGELYVQLADQLPSQHVSPYTTLITQSIASVLADAQSQLERHGEAGLVAYCGNRLVEAQAQLRKMLDFAEGAP